MAPIDLYRFESLSSLSHSTTLEIYLAYHLRTYVHGEKNPEFIITIEVNEIILFPSRSL